MTGYDVDVDELSAAVSAMSACSRALADLHADVEAVTTRLHGEWAGLARDASASSHIRWRDEFTTMTAALDGLRGVGDTARANYTAAVEANLGMWAQVR